MGSVSTYKRSLVYVSYVTVCRSIHNVRIERLWVDVTNQVGATWSARFTNLELQHAFDINNVSHIWLLQYLFLPIINNQLNFFTDTWNQHRIQIRRGPNRSSADMFTFDMYANGIRGDQLPQEENLSPEELEVFGVDWEGLEDRALLDAQRSNNASTEGAGTWLNTGPPQHLNEVQVEPPVGPTPVMEELDALVEQMRISVMDDAAVINVWIYALGLLRARYPDQF